jgi:hypothetical protein
MITTTRAFPKTYAASDAPTCGGRETEIGVAAPSRAVRESVLDSSHPTVCETFRGECAMLLSRSL